MLTLPTLPSRIVSPLDMLLYIRRLQPTHTILLKRLDPGLELRLLQAIIINRADARYTSAGVSAATSVHERSTDAAEAVLHVISRGNGVFLAEAREFVFAAGVFHVCVFNDEVGCEHARGLELVGKFLETEKL
jgi:hypothetical protein